MTNHQDTTRPGHPIESFLCAALEDLQALADVPTWSMDQTTTDRVVLLAAKVAASVAELEARAIGQAVSLERPASAQCRGLTQWLRLHTNVTARTAARKAALAQALTTWEPTRAATARGEIHPEQAQAIADKIGMLEDDITTHDKQRAEAFLLDQAADQDADALTRMGHEIYQRLDPEGADAREAEALARAEARARTKTRLRLYDVGEGLTHGTFTIPTLHGAILRKALAALAAPKHVRAQNGPGSYDWQPPPPRSSARPSATTSPATRPTSSPSSAACPPPSSPSATPTSSKARSRPPASTPGPRSATWTTSAWPAKPASCRCG
jgi:hypothetical protein